MGKEDVRLVKEITPMSVDFARWYTDIVTKAELCDYSSIKGFMIIRPYGYAIWENIKNYLDEKFKESNHENMYMPMLLPESLLQREKDHVEGFAPEVAWVTHGGNEKLEERLCIRPTSETVFCEHFEKIVESHNDLPILYNQWCSVVRWEKTTRPFLRTTEFLWQEGHTLHKTKEEAKKETIDQLNTYIDLYENYLAIPVISGKKTDKEKFAGAKETYTVEAMMKDGKALQSATSHNFSDGFTKAFNIKYQDVDGKLKNPFQTSWGLSTRSIGAVIMVHGDDKGLVLAPKVAPIQVIIVPINTKKIEVVEKVKELEKLLKQSGIRVKSDFSNKSPGWKFSQYEMKGVPLRIEVGPRDLENESCVISRRDTFNKKVVNLKDIEKEVKETLQDIHNNLFSIAKKRLEDNIFSVNSLEEIKNLLEAKNDDQISEQNINEENKKESNDDYKVENKFFKASWCGDLECELRLKEEFSLSSRCILLENEDKDNGNCICCNKKAKHKVIFGKSY